MFWFLLYLSFSVEPLIYRDDTNQVVVDCSSDPSGEVIIPQSVIEIYSKGSSDYAFMNCQYSIKTLRFEANSQLTSISPRSFSYTRLQSADFSECHHLAKLNESLFWGCSYLNSLKLPLYEYCFYQTVELKSIDLPDSVISLWNDVFYRSGLTTINISTNSKLKLTYGYIF